MTLLQYNTKIVPKIQIDRLFLRKLCKNASKKQYRRKKI